MSDITREFFEQQRRPRFGNANPERVQMAFWEWMIRGEDQPDLSEEGVLGKFGLMKRNGVLKSGYGPWRARDRFGVEFKREDGPIWTFDRMGRTETELPDGRTVYVGGEHEDFYDPDFCIYNDVVVFEPDGTFQIYGYPEVEFPPTDFHTATLVGHHIILIGGLRYPKDRSPGTCTVFRLDTTTFAIERVVTSGDGPGWLFHHTAELHAHGITVRGGEQIDYREEKQVTTRNVEEYRLDTESWTWLRLTDRRAWREFEVQAVDGLAWFSDFRSLPDEVFFSAERIRRSGEYCFGLVRRIEYEGISVEFCDRFRSVTILICGELSDDQLRPLLEAFVVLLEKEIGRKCRLSPQMPENEPGA